MIEELISTDLAALAAHDRQNVGPLVLPEATRDVRVGFVAPWQALIAAAVVAASGTVGARILLPHPHPGPIWFWPTPAPIEPWLVGSIIVAVSALAYLAATRVVVRRDSAAAFASATGAAWAGSVTALACAVGSWFAIQNPGDILIAHHWDANRYAQPELIAALFSAVVLGAAAVGSTWRGRVGATSPTRLAMIQLGGITSFLVMFGLMWSTCDHWPWRELFSPARLGNPQETWWHPQVVIVRWAVGGSLLGVIGSTIAIGVACVRERTPERARLLAALEHGSMVPLAIALGIATLVLEHRFDTGYHTLPFGPQLLLAALGTSAVTLFVATLTLRQRRRALAQISEAVGPATPSRWLTSTVLVVTFTTAGVLLEGDVRTFNEARQLAVVLVLVVVAMLGFVGLRPARVGRPLADVLAAGIFTVVAVAGTVVGWHQHKTDCVSFDGLGGTIGPCQIDPVVTTTSFVVISWAIVAMTAAVAAGLIRREGPRAWSIPAKLVVVTVLLTWLGLIQYKDRWIIDVINFHYTPNTNLGAHGLEPPVVHVMWGSWSLGDMNLPPSYIEGVRSSTEPAQWNALETGLALFGLALSIGVACLRERKRPSRWLALLESPVIVPLGVIVAMASLFLASEQWDLFQFHRGDPDDIPWWAAIASIGAVVAYASMLLRRRRREALS